MSVERERASLANQERTNELLEKILEELTLLRESQAPPKFPRIEEWKVWLRNRVLGPQAAAAAALAKQAEARALTAVSANPRPAQVIQSEHVDREAPYVEAVAFPK